MLIKNGAWLEKPDQHFWLIQKKAVIIQLLLILRGSQKTAK